MDFTFEFIRLFCIAITQMSPILLFFLLWIVFLGQCVGFIEGWKRFDAIYWSFITAFTVGYGDIRPEKRSSRVLAVFVALIGIMFTGVIVAATVTAAAEAYTGQYGRMDLLQTLQLS